MSRHLSFIFAICIGLVFLILTLAIAPVMFGELEATGSSNLTNSSQYISISGIVGGGVNFMQAGAFVFGVLILILALFFMRRA